MTSTTDKVYYDPTLPERPEDAKKHNRKRPSSHYYMWGLNCGSLFQTWPDYPNEIGQYGPYYVRWQLPFVSDPSWYSGFPQVSINEIHWYNLKELLHGDKSPSWWSKDNFIAEVEKKVKEFKKNRSRFLAKKRREKIKEEAKEAGMDLKEYKKLRSQKSKKKRALSKKKNTGKKMAKQLEKKMKVAMVLKSLKEATDTLQEKLEDENADLRLAYVNNKIKKLKSAIWTLQSLSVER